MKLELFALLVVAMFGVLPKGQAQLGDRLARAAARGAERAIERKAEEKAAEAVEEALSKPKDQPESDGSDGALESDYGQGAEGQGANGADNTSSSGSSPSERGKGSTANGALASPFRADSKFDFEAGQTIIYYDDFGRVSIGDFPTGYNTLGSAEVVTVSSAPGKWLRLNQQTSGLSFIDVPTLPADFTVEFDVIHDVPTEGYRYQSNLGLIFTDAGPEAEVDEDLRVGDKTATFWIRRDISRGFLSAMTKYAPATDYSRGTETQLDAHFNESSRGKPQHVAFWRQGRRIRMYINQQKVFDVPMAWPDSEPITGLRFFGAMSEVDDSYYVSNIRIAKGAPDTRSKLLTEGKLVTYGITFASGSDKLEPGSAGTLKSIATVLSENPAMKLSIVGHTDSNGNPTDNQSLSERRAAAVKTALSNNYGIAADRLSTAGKGEAEPLSTEDSAAAKARNRRVVLEVKK